MGTLTLSVGQIHLTSEITWESKHFVFAVLHLGGWDFHCCITGFNGRLAYTELKQQLFADIKQASAAQIILTMNSLLGDRALKDTAPHKAYPLGNRAFNLQHLFAEERQRMVNLLTAQTKKHLDQLYTQVYRENYSMLAAFQREGMPVPQELKVAAEVALSCRCLETASQIETAIEEPTNIDTYLAELNATATEANYLECWLNIPEVKTILEQTIVRLLWQLLYDGDPATLAADVNRIEQAIALGQQFRLGLTLDKAQEMYLNCLNQYILPNCLTDNATGGYSCRWNIIQIKPLLELGQSLAIDVSTWL